MEMREETLGFMRPLAMSDTPVERSVCGRGRLASVAISYLRVSREMS